MIDWSVPDAGDARLTLAYHVTICGGWWRWFCADASVGQVILLGHCPGGTLSLIYMAFIHGVASGVRHWAGTAGYAGGFRQ